MSGWWKNCSFPLLPLPSFLVGIPTSERTVARATWPVLRYPLRRPSIPTATSLPRILSTLRKCSSCSSNKLRILSQPLHLFLVNLGNHLNSHRLLKHPSTTITLTSSLALMMSTSTVADTSGRPWLLHSMGSSFPHSPSSLDRQMTARLIPSVDTSFSLRRRQDPILYALQKSGRIPADSCTRNHPIQSYSISTLPSFVSLPHLILTLYHYHHRVLLKYIGSLGLFEFSLHSVISSLDSKQLDFPLWSPAFVIVSRLL